MTIPRKGSRPIEIDGRQFRFMVKPHHEELTVTIQEDQVAPGRVLQFRWPQGCSVLPQDIREAIVDGMRAGWDPSARGPAFRFGLPKASAINNDE